MEILVSEIEVGRSVGDSYKLTCDFVTISGYCLTIVDITYRLFELISIGVSSCDRLSCANRCYRHVGSCRIEFPGTILKDYSKREDRRRKACRELDSNMDLI